MSVKSFWDVFTWIFMLIAVYLLLVYWYGATKIGKTAFDGLNSTITSLQGRGPFGQAQYPALPKGAE